MALLRRVLAHEEDARDAWQETWYTLWRAHGRLRRTEDPWPFIRKAALSRAIDRVRALRRKGREGGLEIDVAAPERAAVPVEFDLDVLDREERACLVLHFWEGLSVREIAGELDVPTGTVKTWMFRARGKLRRRITLVREREEETG